MRWTTALIDAMTPLYPRNPCNPWSFRQILNRVALALFCLSSPGFLYGADDGVFVRFRLLQPDNARYYVKVAGFVHVANWYLPDKTIPTNADKKPEARLNSGEFTEWVDLKAQFGKSLHGRHNRAGGIAEFPNITARFVIEPKADRSEVEIELATAADPAKIVKRWHENFREYVDNANLGR